MKFFKVQRQPSIGVLKNVLKKLQKLTGSHQSQSFFFNTVTGREDAKLRIFSEQLFYMQLTFNQNSSRENKEALSPFHYKSYF